MDVVVFNLLPELMLKPPPRLFIPSEVVYEGALRALMWGGAIGAQFPEKVTALFRMIYGGKAAEKLQAIRLLLERHAAKAKTQRLSITIENLLPERLIKSPGPMSAYDAWNWLVVCFVEGCTLGEHYAGVFRELLAAWNERDDRIHDFLGRLKSSGEEVPDELLSNEPLSTAKSEREIFREARELLEKFEAEFGPLERS